MIKTGIYRTALLILAFFLFTMAVVNVDVQPIGPDGSQVGFASVNGAVHAAFPQNDFWHEATSVLGYLALATVAGFALLGAAQVITRRSLKKVDFQLIALGIFFVVMLLCYVVFEKLEVNWRPVILDEAIGLEASYPSSHTMLALCVFGALLIPYPQLLKGKAAAIVRIACLVLMVVSTVGRLLSGVHWLTDIVASMLLSAALLSFLVMLLQLQKLRKKDAGNNDAPHGNWDDSTVSPDDGFGDLFRNE